ncbi:MAG: tetratricopeptide repeat protein [Nocardioides sp.]
MTNRPRWDRTSSPAALAHYVPRDLARFLPERLAGVLPARGAGSVLPRAQQLFTVLAQAGIRYGHEPASSGPGRQVVREPGEVLAGPRHGTCLDLAVLYAGGCLDAGLHPVIVVLEPGTDAGPAHALVLLRADADWAGEGPVRPDDDDPFAGVGNGHGVWVVVPEALRGRVRSGVLDAGTVLAVDVTLAALNAPGRSSQVDPEPAALWDSAVERGGRLIRDAGAVCAVDIGLIYRRADTHHVLDRPRREPLAPPYDEPDPSAEFGPLQAVKARAGLVPFCDRDELDALRDWFEAPAHRSVSLVRPAVVHGVGGAGKTRLAAELCRALTEDGWYAGFADRSLSQAEHDYLTHLACPVLIVVDYPEGAYEKDLTSLLAAIAGRRDPTGLLFTSRQYRRDESQWWQRTLQVAQREGVTMPAEPRALELAQRHPASDRVYATALARFTSPSAPPVMKPTLPPSPRGGSWTTLDLILLAWLAAHTESVRGDASEPDTAAELYDKVLGHEFEYWRRVYRRERGAEVLEELLGPVGAAVTALQPASGDAAEVLSVLAGLRGDPGEARRLADVLSRVLAEHGSATPDGPDDVLALRPDPVGDHLLIATLDKDPDFLVGLLTKKSEEAFAEADQDTYRLTEAGRFTACVVLTRAAQRHEAASEHADHLLRALPELWAPALGIALRAGGPFAHALRAAALRRDTAIPWAEVESAIPAGYSTMVEVGVAATEAAIEHHGDSESPDDLARWAGLLNNLGIRLSEAGRRAEALEPTQEAVTLRRELAAANPAAYAGDLASSLNNLGIRLSEAGRRAEALEPTQEAVTLYRELAAANPAAYAGDLARSLNNLGAMLSEAGRRAEALEPTQEAVTLYRELAAANPAAYAGDLASSLNNLGAMLSEAGRPLDGTFDEAVEGLPRMLTAWLLGHRAVWASNHAPDLVQATITRAVELADDLPADAGAPEAGDLAWVGQVRQSLRQMITELGEQGAELPAALPQWATTPWPDSVAGLANQWLGAQSWSDRESVLTAYAAVPAEERSVGLTMLRFLHPTTATSLDELTALLAAIDETGLDQLLGTMGPVARHQELVFAWLATPDWGSSRELLQASPELLSDPMTEELLRHLAGQDHSGMAEQHLGILSLARRPDADQTGIQNTGIDSAYAIVTNPDTASDAAWAAVTSADAERLSTVLTAAPHLLKRPFSAPALMAALALLHPEAMAALEEVGDRPVEGPPAIDELVKAAAEQGTEVQRAALSNRFTRITRQRPDLAATIERLLPLLDA